MGCYTSKIILPEKKREVRIKKLSQVYYISQNELFKDLEEELKHEEKINIKYYLKMKL